MKSAFCYGSPNRTVVGTGKNISISDLTRTIHILKYWPGVLPKAFLNMAMKALGLS